jgi:hypothetical protein
MKNKIIISFLSAFLFFTNVSMAQQAHKWEDIDSTGYYKKETISQNGVTLIFINKDSLANPQSMSTLKQVFWEIYPKEMKRFNKKSPKTVTILLGDEYKGVAASLNAVVKIDKDYIRKNPEDVDLLTHELMHVVQGYTYDVPDNWLTDGIADYARYAFGINNIKSGWALPRYQAGQSFKNSYRIAARFLLWIEKNKRTNIVDQLDRGLRNGKYNRHLWVKLTGSSLDELWTAYIGNPNVNITG